MDKLIYTLKSLSPDGKRLENGLALRITRGNGFCMLGASRVGVAPGLEEMKVLARCVGEVWHPSHIWRDKPTMRQRTVNGRLIEDHIWRLYWPLTNLELVMELAVQDRFPL